MEFLMKNIDPSTQSWDSYPGFVKKIWVPMTQLKAKQYQIVCVGGGFIEDCLEYTVTKLTIATCLTFNNIYEIVIINRRAKFCAQREFHESCNGVSIQSTKRIPCPL